MNAQGFFESEEELAQVLCNPRSNLSKIEQGLEPWGREFPAWHGERIDLLCRSAHGDWVAVELKVKKADHRVFGQMLIYLLYLNSPEFSRWLLTKKYRESYKARGVILAHEIEPDLKWLTAAYATHVPRIDLKEYRRTADGISIEEVLPGAPQVVSISRFKRPLKFL